MHIEPLSPQASKFCATERFALFPRGGLDGVYVTGASCRVCGARVRRTCWPCSLGELDGVVVCFGRTSVVTSCEAVGGMFRHCPDPKVAAFFTFRCCLKSPHLSSRMLFGSQAECSRSCVLRRRTVRLRLSTVVSAPGCQSSYY